MLTTIWFTWGFNLFAGGQALTFTIQRFSRNPQIISLVMTLTGLVILGPIISYMSDQLWTRNGRRRPFLIIAWLGGFASMLSFAFLPQVADAVNRMLSMVGAAPVGELVILAVVIACYKKMWDGQAALEPLFLECVPPHQRGRFWAIRGMMFTLSVTIFYQILWPVYDRNIDMLGWIGHPGAVYMYGERAIYILAAGLFLLTGVFLVFCVEETRMPEAPNKSFRELLLGEPLRPDDGVALEIGPVGSDRDTARSGYRNGATARVGLVQSLHRIPVVALLASFGRDVLFKAENIPYYIVLIIPGLESGVWGNFNALMQNDQFHYSKQAQADWAFPLQLLTFFVLTPFAGWYSDVRSTIRWWLRMLLLAISGTSLILMLWALRRYSPSDIHEVPGFAVLSLVTVLAAVSMGALYVPMVETLLDYVGREHARAWVSLLTVVKAMITVGILYICILRSAGQVLPIMVWMAFAVVGGTLGTLMDTFIGPMIYDYMPRSQIGTINSGKGILDSFLGFGVANLGAWWVVFFTTHFHRPVNVEYDYTSMYILQFLLFIPAIWAKVYFIRLVVDGRITKLGAVEQESPKDAVLIEQLSHPASNGVAVQPV